MQSDAYWPGNEGWPRGPEIAGVAGLGVYAFVRYTFRRKRGTLDKSSPPSAIPTSVTKAMQAELGLEITGYLSSVEYGPGERFLRGVVFGDREKRFDDGEPIRTSVIMTECR